MKYQVYVIELSKRVFSENTKFRNANPQFNGVLECLYIGMTSKTPKERFQQHKTGYVNKKGYKISAYIVQKYGIYLSQPLRSYQFENDDEKRSFDSGRKTCVGFKKTGLCSLVQLIILVSAQAVSTHRQQWV